MTSEELRHEVAVLVRQLGRRIEQAPFLAEVPESEIEASKSIEDAIVLLVRTWLELRKQA